MHTAKVPVLHYCNALALKSTVSAVTMNVPGSTWRATGSRGAAEHNMKKKTRSSSRSKLRNVAVDSDSQVWKQHGVSRQACTHAMIKAQCTRCFYTTSRLFVTKSLPSKRWHCTRPQPFHQILQYPLMRTMSRACGKDPDNLLMAAATGTSC